MVSAADTRGDVAQLEKIALQLRIKALEMIAPTQQGYVQQGLGAADIFTALYFSEAKLDAGNPSAPARDRIFLTTAHNTAIFYAALARRGFFDEAKLADYCKDGSPLEINSSERMGAIVEATCGSLGQGLSVAVGVALSLKRRGLDSRVYAVIGDGEMQEGQIWEAMMSAGGFRLDNLCLILDYNYMQSEGPIEKVLPLEPAEEKLRSFGFAVSSVDGNNMKALLGALEKARETKGAPSFIIAKTLVGKGVSFLEGLMAHQLKFPPEISKAALEELRGRLALL